MVDQESHSFIREVNEELRQEQLEKVWKKYGNYVIGGAVGIVMIVAGNQGWKSYQTNRQEDLGNRYYNAQALSLAGKTGEALDAFADLAGDGDGLAVLAQLRQAALTASTGDSAEAEAQYRAIAADMGVDKPFRDLATILGAYEALDRGDAVELQARLAPLMGATNSWRHSAKELTALLALKTGNVIDAKKLFSELASEPAVPQGIRARAVEFTAAVN